MIYTKHSLLGEIVKSEYLFHPPSVTTNTVLIMKSALTSEPLTISPYYDHVIMNKRRTFIPTEYELGRTWVKPQASILTEFTPLHILQPCTSDAICNYDTPYTTAFIVKDVINIDSRWEEVKKLTTIGNIISYCRLKRRDEEEYVEYEGTKCFHGLDYIASLLGDTLYQEPFINYRRYEIMQEERFPSRILDIDNISEWHGVYLCFAEIGEPEDGDSDTHFFIIYCNRDRLELLNTYGVESQVYLYVGTKREWVSLITSTSYDDWDYAFGLPTNTIERIISGFDINMRYRKLY